MAAEVHGLRVDHNGLFTTVEHAVLANWFDQQTRAVAAHIKWDDALAQLGFDPSSARASTVSGTVRPRALALL
jgi:hypothetical protein